jgi:thioredoxin 1
MKPILEDVKKSVGDSAKIIKVDIDLNQHVAQHYNIQSVPTLVLFKQGKILWRQSGVVPAPQLKQLIESNL